MQVRQIGGISVAYIQSSPYLQSSLFSEDVFARTGADVVMFYSSKGKVSIRRNNESVSCREIASCLSEGGGHDYAAGAKFKSDPNNINSVISELEVAVAKAISAKAEAKS
jgi:nanoRNase/pAp phosphatase (c-di-AMP/oligoRNAs hydrolase)